MLTQQVTLRWSKANIFIRNSWSSWWRENIKLEVDTFIGLNWKFSLLLYQYHRCRLSVFPWNCRVNCETIICNNPNGGIFLKLLFDTANAIPRILIWWAWNRSRSHWYFGIISFRIMLTSAFRALINNSF